MARCIDADKAKEEIKSSFCIDSVIFGELMSFRDGKIGVDNLIHEINVQAVEEAVNTLENVETEEVAPVTHAHWIRNEFGVPICSACHKGWDDQPEKDGSPLFEYCPCCGAIMDEEVGK